MMNPCGQHLELRLLIDLFLFNRSFYKEKKKIKIFDWKLIKRWTPESLNQFAGGETS